MLKKICSLTLVVIMSLTLLAGCGSKESAKNGKDEPYQIDWYFIGDPQPNVKEIEEEANKYLKGKINATLKINSLDWGSYASRLNVMIAGNEKFDICFTDSSNYKSNASRQAYLPLNELIDKYAPKTKEMLGEDFLKGSQINNVNYALPANKDRGHSYGVVYRKDIADKYGLTEKMKSIKSFADLKPILAFIKEKEPDLIPLTHESGNAMTMLLDFEELAYPAGFVGGSTDGKVVNLVETPEFLEAIKITHQNYVDGFLPKGGKVGTPAGTESFCSIEPLKPGKAQEIGLNRGFEMEQVELTPRRMNGADSMGSMMAISRTSKNPELVMQFLELYNTDKYLNNLIVFGIEGKNYNKVDDKTIKPIENSGYDFSVMRWEFGNTFLQYLTEIDDPEKFTNTLEFNKSVIPSEYLGFNFDPEKVKSEYGACQNVKLEFNDRCSDGMEDPEALVSAYIEKLKRAGSGKIVEEAQRQYDEWKNSQK